MSCGFNLIVMQRALQRKAIQHEAVGGTASSNLADGKLISKLLNTINRIDKLNEPMGQALE